MPKFSENLIKYNLFYHFDRSLGNHSNLRFISNIKVFYLEKE